MSNRATTSYVSFFFFSNEACELRGMSDLIRLANLIEFDAVGFWRTWMVENLVET